MKTISKSVVLFLAIALAACQKDIGQDTIRKVSDIRIVDGMIVSPKWLVDEVNSVADKYSHSPHTGEKLYPSVYSLTYYGLSFILLIDPASGTVGRYYFTLRGEPVEIGSELHYKLEETRENDNIGFGDTKIGLVWIYKYKSSRSTSTRVDQPISFYTPNGTLIPDTWTFDEWYNTPVQIAYGRNYFKLAYPNAEELSGPSTTYNCHGYAWHVTEGGSPVWIGASSPGQTNIFVEDGSYVATSPNTPGAKVRYLNADHSAIAETANIFVSKWNEYPLYRHHKNYSPFGSSPQVAYYQRAFSPVITGSNSPSLDTNVTYSVSAPLSGVTFNGWTITPNTYTATGGLSNRNLTIKFTAYRTYTISANFTLPNGSSYAATRQISVMPPTPSISSEHVPIPETNRGNLVITVDEPIDSAVYEWMVNNSPYVTTTSSPHQIAFLTPYIYNSLRSLTNITVKCRARIGQSVSLWSNEIHGFTGTI